jgi:hypothetical protein
MKTFIYAHTARQFVGPSDNGGKSKLVWEWWKVLCDLSSWNTTNILSVPSYCAIQGGKDLDALATEGSSSPFLGPEPAISISPCADKLG